MNVEIIGGSVGGLSTAISLKEHDPEIHVTLNEKYKTIGYNHEGRRCGEAYSIHKPWDKWIPDEKSIFNKIHKYEFFFGEKKLKYQIPSDIQYIINRQEFISKLAQKAEKLGVNILVNNKIRTIKKLKSDYIIDASGCPSTVKRELGLPKRSVGFTYQQTIEDSNCFTSDTMKFYLAREGGYYWIFPRDPKKNEINVGIGIHSNLKHDLKHFLEKFKLKQKIEGEVNYVLGGLVPVGIQNPLRFNNIFFVGDAGVGAEHFSGAGVPRALVSGHIAGECIAEQYPEKYAHMIKKMYIGWDTIGAISLKINNVLYKIDPGLFLKIEYMAFRSLNKLLH